MNIAIVEDCKEHSDFLKKYIVLWGNKIGEKMYISQFASAEEFLFHYEESINIDAVFLDIQMPGLSGVELARKIRIDNRDISIVFTTGIDDYIEEGYELEAVHYLMKPLDTEKIEYCLSKINEKNNRNEQYVVLKNEEDVFRVAASKIWWVSAIGHGVLVGIEDNKEVKRTDLLNSIGEIEKTLEYLPQFVKTHRSYLVNLEHVKRIKKTEVMMDNGDEIPLSRRMYKVVNDKFIRFFTSI